MLQGVLHGRSMDVRGTRKALVGHGAVPIRRRRDRGVARASRAATTTGAHRGASRRARRIRTKSSKRPRGARRSKRPASRSTGPLVDLGHVDYTRSKKRVHAFAAKAPEGAAPRCASWEVDKAEFIEITRARRIIHPDQAALLDRLQRHLGALGERRKCREDLGLRRDSSSERSELRQRVAHS